MAEKNDNRGIGARLMDFLMIYIARIDVFWLVLGPLMTGLASIVIGLYIGEMIFEGEVAGPYIGLVVSIGSFIAGFGGLFQIIKREFPLSPGYSLEGNWALISGFSWLAVCWIFSLFLLITALTGDK